MFVTSSSKSPILSTYRFHILVYYRFHRKRLRIAAKLKGKGKDWAHDPRVSGLERSLDVDAYKGMKARAGAKGHRRKSLEK